jgi:DNA-binding transcriptional LysR family regulator
MAINLSHIGYVLAVAQSGSITEASSRLRISQPAVSAAIKGIEDHFGYKIFVRNPARGLSLTPAGRDFVRRARHLHEHVLQFTNEAVGLGEKVAGEVHVGWYSITTPFLFPLLYTQMMRSYPDVSVVVHEGNMVETVKMLEEGTVDLGISYDMFVDNSVRYESLAEVVPHVLLSDKHRLANRKSITLEELAEEQFILLDLPVMREYYLGLFHQYRLKPHIIYRPRSFELVRSLVGLGIGYSFGFMPVTDSPTYGGDLLVKLPLENGIEKRNLCIVTSREGITTRKANAVAQACREGIGRVLRDS